MDEQKLGAPVDAYVEAVFALAKLRGVKEAPAKLRRKYDWIDHISGYSLVDKIFD